jgi:predicted ribosome quality control (RQC) complex YloA/Tae2 family protein
MFAPSPSWVRRVTQVCRKTKRRRAARYTPGVSFDALTLAAIRDELDDQIGGGLVRRVVQVGPLIMGLEIYAHREKHFLLCSAEPLAARVCLSESRPVRDSDTPTPFLLLLRKYVRDGRIVGIQQPRYERLLKLQITKRNEEGVPAEFWLIIETMGRRSNVLLVGSDGLIVEALRRAGPKRNPRRPILPRHPYVEPPPQHRLDPLDPHTFELLRSEASSGPASSLEGMLASRLAGFSPLAAREAAYRATGSLTSSVSDVDWQAAKAAVWDLLRPLETHNWTPTVCQQNGEIRAFAPYRLTHLHECVLDVVPSISKTVELGMASTARPQQAPLANRALLEVVERHREQSQRKLAALERSLETANDATALKDAADAVLANLVAIETGQTSLEFNGLQIELDPTQTPVENAQRLYREYRKARDAGRQVPALITTAQLRLQQLDQLGALAMAADTPARQRALREELDQIDRAPIETEAGTPASQSAKKIRKATTSTDGRVLRRKTTDGLEVLVGTSGRGNETVTFKLAQPEDIWLHARGVPGAHVILRTSGRQPAPGSIAYAARLAAQNSQARSAGRVEVDYTHKKHVRKIPGAPPGLVTYTGEKTLPVDLTDEE